VIGRDHLDSGSVASPNRETEAMKDGSDAVSDWPLLNALLNTAGGATWVSLHHGGGVGMGYSQHSGVVIAPTAPTRPPSAGPRAGQRLRHRRDAPCRCRLRQPHTAAGARSRPVLPPGIRASAALVKRATEGDAAVYGVNTGFGKLAMKRIAREDLATLQLKLLRSHAVGVGEPMSERVVRLILVLKAASLARGYSGVREEVVDALIALHNAGVVPVIPCQGSVGASGDLAPLAHLCLPLIGEGEVFYQGQRMPGGEALAVPASSPSPWAPKKAWR
jgi:hypothetical protein